MRRKDTQLNVGASGIPVGLGVGVFQSETWVGASGGLSMGWGIPVGPVSVAGNYAFLYFERTTLFGFDSIELKSSFVRRCACMALRDALRDPTDDVRYILKAVADALR